MIIQIDATKLNQSQNPFFFFVMATIGCCLRLRCLFFIRYTAGWVAGSKCVRCGGPDLMPK